MFYIQQVFDLYLYMIIFVYCIMLALYTSLFDIAYVPLLPRWSLPEESSDSIRALWKHGLVECFIAVCQLTCYQKYIQKTTTHWWFWYLRTKTAVFWTQ